MIPSVRHLLLAVSLITSTASAQNGPTINVFFGFDFVLQPLAIKWACGGEAEADLAVLNRLITAFPEDAERAELPNMVDVLFKTSHQEGNLAKLLGTEITPQQAEQLCATALPLSIGWLTPEQLETGDGNDMPKYQKTLGICFSSSPRLFKNRAKRAKRA